MKVLSFFAALLITSTAFVSCNKTSDQLSEQDIVNGLKEALKVGSQSAVDTTSRKNGYYGNSRLFIPFPEDAKVVADALESIGLGSVVDSAVLSINRAAEDAADQALPIFIDAITSMTIEDGSGILYGDDSAATHYLRVKTLNSLTAAFKPKIQSSLDGVGATAVWSQVMSLYNAIPFVNPVNTDLGQYATDKALKGLFVVVKDEEKDIRKDPSARVNDILKRVFGQLDN